MTVPHFSIILPCYNESKNIPLIVERIEKFWPKYNFELLLVNNGSTDDSAQVLEKIEAENEYIRVVTINQNRGYGHGILSGLKVALGDIISYSHADIQTPPEDMFKAYDLYQEKREGQDGMFVKGERINRRKDEQFYTATYALVAQLLLGYKLEDINGQPKLFHKKFLTSLEGSPIDFSFDVYVLYKAMQNGLRMKTFPVDFNLRLHGESNWSSSPVKKYKTILGYLKNILLLSLKNISDTNNPIKQFLIFCSIGCFGVLLNFGIFYILYTIFQAYYVTASLIGYFIAGFFVYFLNKQWTFNIREKDASHVVKFAILVSITFAINGVTIFFLTDIFHLIPEISQVFTMGITIGCNFLGSKFWVFKKKTVWKKLGPI